MIEIAAESKKLDGPAADLKELTQRLMRHIGSTVSVELKESGYEMILVGELESVKYETNFTRENFSYYLKGVEPSKHMAILKYSFKVLLDGSWKPIHEPEQRGELVR